MLLKRLLITNAAIARTNPHKTIVGLIPIAAATKPISGEPIGVPPIKIIR